MPIVNKIQSNIGAPNIGGGDSPYSLFPQSRLPIKTPQVGQSGDPSTSASMSYSRLSQQTMTDDDIEYWMGDPDDPDDVGATFDPPYQIRRFYTDYGTPDQQRFGENILRQFIKESIMDEDESYDESDIDEASSVGGGSIAGYIVPLGTDPMHKFRKKNKKHYEPTMRAFGGAKEVS